jgi:Exo-beta-D-glucosaminidase Ig-fold domain
VTVRSATHGPDRLTATVRNDGTTVAAMLWFSLRGRHSGEQTLPARYSDTVWLLPGESRTIAVTNQAARPNAALQLAVEGCNT